MHAAKRFRTARPILLFIVLLWAVEIVNLVLGHSLNQWFGLEPRRISGLVGIPAMPLLHGGLGHLAANTASLLVLGIIGLAVAPRRFWFATFVIVLVSGLAVWLLARPGVVVGASGLVFGWFGFVIALGALERSARTLIGALLVILLYGGMIWGVLPLDGPMVSWEAHLFGALAGVAAAALFRREIR